MLFPPDFLFFRIFLFLAEKCNLGELSWAAGHIPGPSSRFAAMNESACPQTRSRLRDQCISDNPFITHGLCHFCTRPVQDTAGVICAIGANSANFDCHAVVQSTGYRPAADSHSAQPVPVITSQRPLVTVGRLIVPVVLRYIGVRIPQRNWLYRQNNLSSLHFSRRQVIVFARGSKPVLLY